MMIHTNRALFGAIVAACAVLTPAASVVAQEDGDLMYERYYYDDAAHTTQVGYERDRCTRYGVGGGPTQGIETPYFDSNPIAICRNGQLYPY